MKKLKPFLFSFALAGFLASVAIHASTFQGWYFGQSGKMLMGLMHIGVFVAFIPSVLLLAARRKEKYGSPAPRLTYRQQLDLLFGGLPLWPRVLFLLLLFYALANFFLNMPAGGPSINDGQYVLSNHGKILKVLTEAEYYQAKTHELRGFSGHWIAFYYFAVLVLVSRKSELKK